MIPLFDALGNHPKNMLTFLDGPVRDRLRAIGKEERYDRIRSLAIPVIQEYHHRDSTKFQGHHQPGYVEEDLSLAFLRTLVHTDRCVLLGERNFVKAHELIQEGHNVLLVQNHTSVLDTYIFYTAIMNTFGHYQNLAFMMSQNFLYVRITALMTAGGNLFRTFQPKHIQRFRDMGGAHSAAATTMMRQNCATLRELGNYCERGGRMVCLYPERDRNQVMGQPEPRYLRMLEVLKPKDPRCEVYVLPVNTTGRAPIIPNAHGTPNEMDTMWDRVQIGYGETHVGAPVKLETIERTLESFGRQQVTHGILGEIPEDEDDLRYLSLGLAFLSMVAYQSSNDRGIYDTPTARTIARRLS
jgi:1-acyl-sn-glycerol-3-phosphate acyltransferase